MIDDANAIEFEINPPDADVTYEPYTEARRRAGVTPVSREHARDLIAQWWEAIAAGLSPPPTH